MLIYFLRLLVLILTYISCVGTYAANPTLLQQAAEQYINQLYQELANQPTKISSRIEFISAKLLGKSYLLGSLGEGGNGEFDQSPLYRIDAFDCQTFVETVMALALAQNFVTFKQYMHRIRYKDGKVSFFHRNHFTCLDWNKNNQRQGYLQDITLSLHNKTYQSVAVWAQTMINRSSWYQYLSSDNNISKKLVKNQAQRSKFLKQSSKYLSMEVSVIPYIALTTLIDTQGRVNNYLLKQIPHAAIIEIIRPNWDLTKIIGTHLNVSHLGFAIWKNDVLYFREASSNKGYIVDYPFLAYILEAKRSATIKGINIQVILPKHMYTARGIVAKELKCRLKIL